MIVRIFTVAGILLAGGLLDASPEDDMEAKVEALLARMTLDEKIGQMSQSTAMRTLTEPIKEEIRHGRWGSFLNAGSPADRAQAQRIARHESRLGIPLLFARDVIHGYRTIFPIPLGQAASWNPELVQAAARIAAREASTEGIKWTFAPMVDIARDPRWGRIAESFGEDPYLAGALATAAVQGFQGVKLNAETSVAACAKHFAGYGAAEAGRDYNSTWIPEILLREVYLRPFRAVRYAGIATFMTAFNTLNGIPATGDRFLLQDILRHEWGFEGIVVSDYEAITEMISHGYAENTRDAAQKAALAGVDMEMVSTSYHDYLKSLVEAGVVPMRIVDDAVRRILRLKFGLGLFEGNQPPPATANVTPDSLDVAERLAMESIVLLKNEKDLLPLSTGTRKIAVIGPLADSRLDQMGTWVMDGRPEDVQTPLAALRQILGAERVLFAPGLHSTRDRSHSGFNQALDVTRRADVALLFVGEEQVLSGEARSRAFLNLPGAQDELAKAIAATGKPLVAIIMAGRPLTFHETAARAGAVLCAWHPGTMGGPALAKLLLGRAVPSGKLAVTFPRTVGQVPIYYAHLNTGRPALESELGIPLGNPVTPIGYTSKYIDVDFTPEYPFGYGLSYTTFGYSNMRVSAPAIREGQMLTVSADVTNRGSREATEVVQLYTRKMVASVAQPVRLLKGFSRVHLNPGEKQTVRFSLSSAELAIYNDQMHLVAEPGGFSVWIAPDSTRGVSAEFVLRQ